MKATAPLFRLVLIITGAGTWVWPTNTYVIHSSSAAKVPPLMLELKKFLSVVEDIVLRAMKVHGSGGVDEIKQDVLRTQFLELRWFLRSENPH